MDEEGDIGLVCSSQEASSSSLASTSVLSSSTSNFRRETDSVVMPKLMPSNSPRSPSSPDLILTPTKATRTVSRSRTLPLRMSPSRRASIPTLEGVSLEISKLERLRGWILGLAIVNFDLDLGPVLTCVFPPAHLSPSEVENIAFSAFPDSPQFEEGSQIHSFRIRESSSQEKRGSLSEPRSTSLSDGYIYGYSHFSQRKNLSSKRGYEQRSIVILSHYPYPALFFHVISKLGPLFHAHGDPILEVACHNIANWPSPAPSTTIELGFLGSVFHAELPLSLDEQQLSNTAHLHSQTEQDTHILVSAPPPTPPPLLLFEASFSHLWSIWEVLILSEPLLVYGPSPAMTSQAVWWLRDLFRPIPWPGDFRPYFTIHDKEHNALVNDKRPKAGLLLGVTNPFFERACKHWPHSLSLGKPRPKGVKSMAPIAAGQPPGWKTKTHKRYTLKDRQLLQEMEDAVRSGPQALDTASANMRRHFSSRTAALLVPFNRYLNTLIPSPSEALHSSRSDRTPRLKPFNNVNFLASLKTHGTPLPFRSNSKQREFYERWLRTPAFGLWLARQEEVVERVLRENAERGLGGQS